MPSSNSQTDKIDPGIYTLRVEYGRYNSTQQAKIFLNEVRSLHSKGIQKVGLTYSANAKQTNQIWAIYDANHWSTGTSGSNQGAVVNQIEQLLRQTEYLDLQQVFQIIPITTMQYLRNKVSLATEEQVN